MPKRHREKESSTESEIEASDSHSKSAPPRKSSKKHKHRSTSTSEKFERVFSELLELRSLCKTILARMPAAAQSKKSDLTNQTSSSKSNVAVSTNQNPRSIKASETVSKGANKLSLKVSEASKQANSSLQKPRKKDRLANPGLGSPRRFRAQQHDAYREWVVSTRRAPGLLKDSTDLCERLWDDAFKVVEQSAHTDVISHNIQIREGDLARYYFVQTEEYGYTCIVRNLSLISPPWPSSTLVPGYCSVQYKDGIKAHLDVSWLSPVSPILYGCQTELARVLITAANGERDPAPMLDQVFFGETLYPCEVVEVIEEDDDRTLPYPSTKEYIAVVVCAAKEPGMWWVVTPWFVPWYYKVSRSHIRRHLRYFLNTSTEDAIRNAPGKHKLVFSGPYMCNPQHISWESPSYFHHPSLLAAQLIATFPDQHIDTCYVSIRKHKAEILARFKDHKGEPVPCVSTRLLHLKDSKYTIDPDVDSFILQHNMSYLFDPQLKGKTTQQALKMAAKSSVVKKHNILSTKNALASSNTASIMVVYSDSDDARAQRRDSSGNMLQSSSSQAVPTPQQPVNVVPASEPIAKATVSVIDVDAVPTTEQPAVPASEPKANELGQDPAPAKEGRRKSNLAPLQMNSR